MQRIVEKLKAIFKGGELLFVMCLGAGIDDIFPVNNIFKLDHLGFT